MCFQFYSPVLHSSRMQIAGDAKNPQMPHCSNVLLFLGVEGWPVSLTCDVRRGYNKFSRKLMVCKPAAYESPGGERERRGPTQTPRTSMCHKLFPRDAAGWLQFPGYVMSPATAVPSLRSKNAREGIARLVGERNEKQRVQEHVSWTT